MQNLLKMQKEVSNFFQSNIWFNLLIFLLFDPNTGQKIENRRLQNCTQKIKKIIFFNTFNIQVLGVTHFHFSVFGIDHVRSPDRTIVRVDPENHFIHWVKVYRFDAFFVFDDFQHSFVVDFIAPNFGTTGVQNG